MTIETLYKEWVHILVESESRLQPFVQAQSSYKIGGNFSAVVSGNVGIRSDYIEYGTYMNDHWDLMLEIGNGVKIDSERVALTEAKKIFEEITEVSKAMGAKVECLNFIDSVLKATIGEDTITASYKYARSFCSVMIKKS